MDLFRIMAKPEDMQLVHLVLRIWKDGEAPVPDWYTAEGITSCMDKGGSLICWYESMDEVNDAIITWAHMPNANLSLMQDLRIVRYVEDALGDYHPTSVVPL